MAELEYIDIQNFFKELEDSLDKQANFLRDTILKIRQQRELIGLT